LPAQTTSAPSIRLIEAPEYKVPGRVDSSVPMVWTHVDGRLTLVAFASWGGVPARMAGPDLEHLQPAGEVVLTPHPGDGIWFESVIQDEVDGTWYGYYHHEQPATVCGRADRSIPRIGTAKSVDRGATWTNLGIILEAPSGSEVCGSSNRFVFGGVGDVSATVDHDWKDVYLYYSNYGRDPRAQGVTLARLAWADRDNPRGRVTIWRNGAWLSPVRKPGLVDEWEYPSGTPLVPTSHPWNDGIPAADAFWGAVDSLEHVVAALRHAAQSGRGRTVQQRGDLRVVRDEARRSARVERAAQDPERGQLVSADRGQGTGHRH